MPHQSFVGISYVRLRRNAMREKTITKITVKAHKILPNKNTYVIDKYCSFWSIKLSLRFFLENAVQEIVKVV